MKKIFGFTLAEVLITLTIIGVIAAITIPNLMQSWRKHQVEVAVKEAYSILNNAITMAKAENGSIAEMMTMANSVMTYNTDYRSARNYFIENYIVPYVKYDRKCISGTCNIIPYSRVIKLDGTTENTDNGNTAGPQLQLKNGMYLGVIRVSGSQYAFIADINGAKGPNRAGSDIFYFSLYAPVYWTDYREAFIGGSCNSCTFKNNASTKDCHTSGFDCAYFIQKNGWKLPDDYPVKKF